MKKNINIKRREDKDKTERRNRNTNRKEKGNKNSPGAHNITNMPDHKHTVSKRRTTQPNRRPPCAREQRGLARIQPGADSQRQRRCLVWASFLGYCISLYPSAAQHLLFILPSIQTSLSIYKLLRCDAHTVKQLAGGKSVPESRSQRREASGQAK